MLAAFALAFSIAAATPADTPKPQHLQAALIAEPSAVAPGKSFWVGLRLKLEPHWHVYWKNPGDAGLPVSIAWTLPPGFSAGPIQWPYPDRIEVPPLMNYGYENEVLFPVLISAPAQAAGKIELKAKAKWVICHDICLPGSADLSLTVDAAPNAAGSANPDLGSPAELLAAKPSAFAPAFRTALQALPAFSPAWSFRALGFDSTLILIATSPNAAASQGAASAFNFFPDENEIIENAAPQKFYPVAGGFALELKRTPLDSGSKGPDSLNGIAVRPQGWGDAGKSLWVHTAIEKGQTAPKALAAAVVAGGPAIAGRSDPGAPGGASGPGNLGVTSASSSRSGFAKLLLMLALAFTGGLILNLMPCVLPVLSLKIFDFVKRAGDSRWKVFSHGLIFTFGVLLSFWVLAGLLLILRHGGSELGWGFQLQSPAFLMILCVLFFFFALSLFGVFEIGATFTRLGGAQSKDGWSGSFLAGVTATVVATPCTAPYMGSALGYAFTQPAYYALLVFTFVGLGMASPYLLLSGFPALMKFLPKPGEWMETLKQFMGFPLLATAIWLAWVLGQQAGVDALIALLGVLLLAGLSAWILGKWTPFHREARVRLIATIVAFLVFVPAFAWVMLHLDGLRESKPHPVAANGAAGPTMMTNGIAWEPFSEARLFELVGQGKPVFVDFTADWCLSCKVNEKVAFGSGEVTRRFRDLNLAVLRADWTLRDETIARALARYGRNSIPLYVLYSGRGPDDYVVLPEVLSPGILLDALKKVPSAPASIAPATTSL